MTVADVLLTPIARRLVVWWPGGGAVYARAVAIEFQDGGRTRQIRIVPIQSLVFGALAVLGLAAIATSFALRRQDRLRDIGEKEAIIGGTLRARTPRGERAR